MSFNRHISRNFNANKTNRIRYDKDDFSCKIYRFDKTFEEQYNASKGNFDVSNGEKKTFHGFTAYRSKNEKNMVITFRYNAKETSSNYRLELLYGNNHRKNPNSSKTSTLMANADITINGEKVQNSMGMIGTDVNFSRNYQYCTLKEGENIIKYSLTSNTIFLGLCIKKYDIWEAKRHNNSDDKLTMIKATVEHTKDFQINTMSAEFMYYHGLDELLEPTDTRANRSGLVFDYRDEINLSVRDTNGKMQRVFGGYISTANVDSDLKIMTLECADRLIDLDRRYCLSEIFMNGYNPTDNISYKDNVDYLRNYNNYSDSLKFLLNNVEIYPRTNVRVGNPLIKRNNKRLVAYRKGAYTKLTSSNLTVSPNKDSITLRNGANTLKGQSVVIFDDEIAKTTVNLNQYPHLYFHYGLGDEKWEEKVEETKEVEVLGSTQASETWIKRANKITSATGSDAIKPIWKYVASFKQSSTPDFYQSASKTWSSKKGNCCCKTEVMLNLLLAKGITDLQYIHCKKKSGEGHVFAKVNGFYVDPSTSSEARGWHNYIKGYGSIVHITTFPNKPFGG